VKTAAPTPSPLSIAHVGAVLTLLEETTKSFGQAKQDAFRASVAASLNVLKSDVVITAVRPLAVDDLDEFESDSSQDTELGNSNDGKLRRLRQMEERSDGLGMGVEVEWYVNAYTDEGTSALEEEMNSPAFIQTLITNLAQHQVEIDPDFMELSTPVVEHLEQTQATTVLPDKPVQTSSMNDGFGKSSDEPEPQTTLIVGVAASAALVSVALARFGKRWVEERYSSEDHSSGGVFNSLRSAFRPPEWQSREGRSLINGPSSDTQSVESDSGVVETSISTMSRIPENYDAGTV